MQAQTETQFMTYEDLLAAIVAAEGGQVIRDPATGGASAGALAELLSREQGKPLRPGRGPQHSPSCRRAHRGSGRRQGGGATLVQAATDSGARVLTGGNPQDGQPGYFYPAALVADNDNDNSARPCRSSHHQAPYEGQYLVDAIS